MNNLSWISDVNLTEGNDPAYPTSNFNLLVTILDGLALFITYVTMFCMGCEVAWSQIKEVIRLWKYWLLGLAGQYLLMPASGFVTTLMLSITGYEAAGILIVTCSPGGGFSNLLTYLFDGEVGLSIILTAVSSSLAFGLMPLNLRIYENNTQFSVPYLQMFVALISLNVAVFFGMLVKWKAPRAAQLTAAFGSAVVSLCNFAWVITWLWANPNVFAVISWKLCVAVAIVIGTGLLFTGVVARLLNFPVKVIKTVAIETAYQSIGTALTVSIISFERQVVMEVQRYIFLYNVSTASGGLILGGLFQLTKYIKRCKDSPDLKTKKYSSVLDINENEESPFDNSL